jgi:hypothetical protein
MALQPSLGLGRIFRFLIMYTVSVDSKSARCNASTCAQNNTQRINAHNTDIHALSGIRTHYSSVRAIEDSSYHVVTVIGKLSV